MLLYFASQIRSQCCMLHLLNCVVFILGGKGGEDSGPLFLNFLDPPQTVNFFDRFIYSGHICDTHKAIFGAPIPVRALVGFIFILAVSCLLLAVICYSDRFI